jgi:serine/threonine-protein kinase RsbT
MNDNATEIVVSSGTQALIAVEKAKELAKKLNFSECNQTKIAIATSELAQNILLHAEGKGKIIISSLKNHSKVGIIVIAEDKGPGIANIEEVLQGLGNSKKGLGIGLSGAKRLMDEFNIESKVGKGTTVIAKKWKSSHSLQKEASYCP